MDTDSFRCSLILAPGRTLLRHFHVVQDLADHVLGRHLFGFRLVGENDPVPEDVHADGPDVFRCHVGAMVQEGMGPGRPGQKDGGSGRRSEIDEVDQLVQGPHSPGVRVAKTMSTM